MDGLDNGQGGIAATPVTIAPSNPVVAAAAANAAAAAPTQTTSATSTAPVVGNTATSGDNAAAGSVNSAGGAQTTATAAAPPVVNPRAAIDDHARSMGRDPSDYAAYPDLATAQAASRMLLSGMMAGVSPVAPQPQQQQAPFTPNAQTVAPQPQQQQAAAVQEFKPIDPAAYGLEPNDPAYKAMQAQNAQLAELHKVTHGVAEQFRQVQAASRAQAASAVMAEADRIVSGWGDATFGTAQTRSQLQRELIDNLHQTAASFAMQARARGAELPLETALNYARLWLTTNPAVLGQPTLGQAVQSSSAALPLNVASGATNVGDPTMKINERWNQNPAMKAKFGL